MEIPEEAWKRAKADKLNADQRFRFKQSAGGGFQEGRCPSCGEPTVWVGRGLYEAKCNRINHCGWSQKVIDLYPEIKETLQNQFSNPDNPSSHADAYLSRRGIDIKKIQGLYTQETAKCRSDHKHYSTVRFYIDKQTNVFWERFIDCDQNHKARFIGSYKELCWPAPKPGTDSNEVWIVEGIFDALSLFQHGHRVIATLSSTNLPIDFITSEIEGKKKIKWILAFDNDKAGHKAIDKALSFLRDLRQSVTVALPPEGKDWNDLHVSDHLGPTEIEDCFWRGKLHLATTKEEYAMILSRKKRGCFVFEWKNRLYSWKPNEEKEDEDKESNLSNLKINRIANFTIRFLYCQVNERKAKTSYFFKISFPNGLPDRHIELDSSEIGERGPFRRALFKEAPGSTYEGDQFWLDVLIRDWFSGEQNIVQVLPWGGYDPATKSYVFKEIAYDSTGKRYKPNSLGFFDLPDGFKIKTDFEHRLEISETLDTGWLSDFRICFGHKGMAALAFWTASLFSEQFREVKKSFPFLAVVGQPGSGKSTLLDFLWKLFGRENHEGIPLSDASTKIGFYRFMEQCSNLPTVFIEDNEMKSNNKFDFEHFKASYNGRIMRVTGKTTQGNETHMPKFRSSIVVGQNSRVDGSQALRERFVEVYFDKAGFTSESQEASLRIEEKDVVDLCGFRHQLLSKHPTYFDELIKYYEEGLAQLKNLAEKSQKPLKNNRVIHTHAVLYGGAKMLFKLFKLPRGEFGEFVGYLLDLARDRQDSVSEDSPLVQLFFETLRDFERDKAQVNHSGDEKFLAVNLTQFFELCGERKIHYFNDIQQLRRELKNSNYYKFVSIHTVRSQHPFFETLRCWIFEKPKH